MLFMEDFFNSSMQFDTYQSIFFKLGMLIDTMEL